MRKHIFPIAAHEAKELYKECHNVKDSVLTRQSGESMQNYILRRKRWYQLLSQLDGTVNLDSTKLGDLLLDSARLSEYQRQLVLTPTRNSTEFAEIADALMARLNQIHKKESGRSLAFPASFPRRGQRRKGKGKGFRRTFKGCAAAEEYQDEAYDENE